MSDPTDLDELLRRHRDALTGYVRRRAHPLLTGRESAADLVQSVCREVVEHFDRFRHGGERGFKRWLFRTADRKIVDRYRYYTAARRTPPERPHPPALYQSPSTHAVAREDLRRASEAFDRLPEATRQVIILSRVHDLSLHEIAELLGTTEPSVRNRLYRGLATIAEQLDGGT